MPTVNFDFGPETEQEVSEECEQMFETLSTNAWDGVLDIIEGTQQESGERNIETTETEGEDNDVVR